MSSIAQPITPKADSPESDRVSYDNLREWAKAHAEAGYAQAKAVLQLLNDYDTLWRVNDQAAGFIISLAERVAAQAGKLSRAAEKKSTEIDKFLPFPIV